MEWGDRNYDENKENGKTMLQSHNKLSQYPQSVQWQNQQGMQTAQQLMVCSSRSRQTLTHIRTSCLCKLGHISSPLVGIIISCLPLWVVWGLSNVSAIKGLAQYSINSSWWELDVNVFEADIWSSQRPFLVENVWNSGKNYLDGPFRVCCFKASIYLLEDIFDLGFRCYCFSMPSGFPHQALIYLLTYIYLRRGESVGGRRMSSSDLLNYLLIRAGLTWGDTVGKDCWSRGKQCVGWWFPTWPWGAPAQHKWYTLEKMCMCVYMYWENLTLGARALQA